MAVYCGPPLKGTPHEYVLTADDVANGDIIVVTAIVEYYDSDGSYNVLGNGITVANCLMGT